MMEAPDIRCGGTVYFSLEQVSHIYENGSMIDMSGGPKIPVCTEVQMKNGGFFFTSMPANEIRDLVEKCPGKG